MGSAAIRCLAMVVCLFMLTACGDDNPEGSRSPADQYTDGSGKTQTGTDDDGGDEGGDETGGETPDVVKIGSGTGSNFVQGALAASDLDLQAGASTDIVVNFVDGTNSAIAEELQVTFTSDCFANDLANFDETNVATSAGRASVTYAAEGCSGTDTVTATAEVQGSILQASVDLSIESDEVLALTFVSAEPEQLALRGMGSGENSRVTFKLVGEQGAAIRNELITFSLSTTAGGVSLAPDADGDPVRETATSDNSGLASVVVRSGTVATTIRVIATHNSTGIQGSSRDLVVSTGVPVHSKFSLSTGGNAPAGAVHTDGISTSVSIIASDQFGNNAFDGTQVSFWSPESGNITSSCILDGGRCSVNWISAGDRPHDGRATVIAYTNGAEDFRDLNGNNVFNDGETWGDLSEAYADHNENGVHDEGEFFVDVTDTNPARGAVGAWDAEEQLPTVWDGPCLSDYCPGQSSVAVWRNLVIIHSLASARLFSFDGDWVSARDCNVPLEREPVDPAPGSTLDLKNGAVTLPSFFVSDARPRSALPCHILGNPMANGTKFEFSTDNGKLQGNVSWKVPALVYEATAIGPLTIEPDDETSEGTLTLTITPPEASAGPPSIFTWAVVD